MILKGRLTSPVDSPREPLSASLGRHPACGRGLPGIILVGLVGPQGAEPIRDLDPDMLAQLHAGIFKIHQASNGEIRGNGPGPNYLFDKELGERALRIVAAPPERNGDDATVDTYATMSSWDAMGGWFRTPLKREVGAWKVVKNERKGGTPYRL